MKVLEFSAVATLMAALVAAPAAAQPAPADQRSPAAIALQTALERVCLPVLAGQPMQATASAARLQQNDSGWWLPAGGKQGVAILPPDSVNPHVCSLTVTYQAGQGAPLYALLDRWSADHGLKPVKVKAASQGPSYAHVTSSWEGQTPQGDTALVLNVEKSLSGAPATGGEGQAAVLLSVTPAAHTS